jgi:hypothetical protein
MLQKQVVLIRKSNQGPHLDKHKKNHFANLDLSHLTGVVPFTSRLLDYLTGHFDYIG